MLAVLPITTCISNYRGSGGQLGGGGEAGRVNCNPYYKQYYIGDGLPLLANKLLVANSLDQHPYR